MNRRLRQFSLKDVCIHDRFWDRWKQNNREVTLPYLYDQLITSGRVENFLKAAGRQPGGFSGMVFNDSDVYKWIEAASYELQREHAPELLRQTDYLIDVILDAQAADGYLNTYIMIEEPDKRWTNLGMMHELYCAGHLIEAAAAHREATGDSRLFAAAEQFADLIHREFLLNQRIGAPGHEEIELALMRLYRAGGNEQHLDLARLFIERRGTEASGFKQEAGRLPQSAGYGLLLPVDNFEPKTMHEFYREFYLAGDGSYDGRYAQDHIPLRKQRTAEGHAVRAMYLYSAAAEVAAETRDRELFSALESIWNNMTCRRMYATGGIGSAVEMEGFTRDYDLPNRQAYAETCAAVGSILWNFRMLACTGAGKYADLLELVLFNGFLSGVSAGGREFFYVNPLSAEADHRRKGWFSVACCPTNAVRILASLESYIYSESTEGIWVHQYISSTLTAEIDQASLTLTQEGSYPWSGSLRFRLHISSPREFTLYLRRPGWSSSCRANIGDAEYTAEKDGYIPIFRTWKGTEVIDLDISMVPEALSAHPLVAGNIGKRVIRRGPLLYCLENADNPGNLDLLRLTDLSELTVSEKHELSDGCTVLQGNALRHDPDVWGDRLYVNDSNLPNSGEKTAFTAVPYCLWGNREAGQMRVWLPCGCPAERSES